jgi:anthranilate/para-aminobenzoate synthase component II
MQVIQKAVKFNFATTIALFSGGPQHDKHAKLIIDKIKKAANGNVSFVGICIMM